MTSHSLERPKSKLRALAAPAGVVLAVGALVILTIHAFGRSNSKPTPTTQPTATAQAAASPSPPLAPTSLVVSYPPGSVAVFPETVAAREGEKPLVFLKREGDDGREWVAQAEYVAEGDANEPATGGGAQPKLVAFVVPQLASGAYTARYEVKGGEAQEPLKLNVRPQIVLREGMVRGEPGNVVEVRAGISPVAALAAGEQTTALPRVELTLTSGDAATADLAPGQSPKATTGDDGFAVWKVRINRIGSAMLNVAADGFEPAAISVEGVAPPSSKESADALAELRRARAEVSAWESESRRADMSAEVLKVRTLVVARQAETALARERFERDQLKSPVGAASANANTSAANANIQRAVQPNSVKLFQERDILEKRTDDAMAAAEARQQREVDAAMRVFRMEAKFATFAPGPGAITFADLLPGDVLLVQSPGYISSEIVSFERKQFQNDASYSHAILYVGKMNIGGQDVQMVAEMLGSGYWLRPLSLSVRKVNFADVYRWQGLSDAQRNLVAEKGKTMFRGAPGEFIRLTEPGFFDMLFAARRGTFYAYPQIELLAAAAAGIPAPVLRASALTVDPLTGGKRRMICSELVAWSYRDAGLDPQIAHWWPALDAAHLFDSNGDDRRKDYTTPNELAGKDSKLTRIGRLSPPPS